MAGGIHRLLQLLSSALLWDVNLVSLLHSSAFISHWLGQVFRRVTEDAWATLWFQNEFFLPLLCGNKPFPVAAKNQQPPCLTRRSHFQPVAWLLKDLTGQGPLSASIAHVTKGQEDITKSSYRYWVIGTLEEWCPHLPWGSGPRTLAGKEAAPDIGRTPSYHPDALPQLGL